MIAYHFPPVQGSSGIQRTLKFSRYLPDHGWEPIVLTVKPMAYTQVSDEQVSEIARSAVVRRVFAVDTARHLAIGGRYLDLLALPDRWVSWWGSAVPVGLALIRKYRPELIWSTYPIATAHLIGLTLKRLTGLPWIADFRDSMTEESYPPEPRRRKVYRWIERNTVQHCSRAVFTTPGALRMYAERYPDLPETRWRVIENGYDEENFCDAENGLTPEKTYGSCPLKLVHSGILYPSERDPRPFFSALSELRRDDTITPDSVKIVLRATGHDDDYQEILREKRIQDIVFLEPPIPYKKALQEMLESDGLLLFQASNCNHQIPAKLYEYLRSRRPIFALTDPVGDTAQTLRDSGVDTIVRIDAKEEISRGLIRFLKRVQLGQAPIATEETIISHARRARTAQLASLIGQLVSKPELLTGPDG